jgi:hypothetical protein
LSFEGSDSWQYQARYITSHNVYYTTIFIIKSPAIGKKEEGCECSAKGVSGGLLEASERKLTKS